MPAKQRSTTEKAAFVLRAVNNPVRQRLLAVLKEGSANVTTLYTTVRLDQSACSQHLAILRKQSLVTTSRRGQEITYTLNQARLESITQTAKQLLK